MLDLARVRQEYMRAGVDEKDLLADPLAQFTRWFDDAVAAQLTMPNAMSLATVSPDNKPSVRLVLLKGVDSGDVSLPNTALHNSKLIANPAATRANPGAAATHENSGGRGTAKPPWPIGSPMDDSVHFSNQCQWNIAALR